MRGKKNAGKNERQGSANTTKENVKEAEEVVLAAYEVLTKDEAGRGGDARDSATVDATVATS